MKNILANVAHALLRAASRLFSTPCWGVVPLPYGHGSESGVGRSADAARKSACATKHTLAILCVLLQFGGMRLRAQDQFLGPETSRRPMIVRPYIAPAVPPVRLANSSRLHDLIRAGTLYLTVQDALALAVENNLNLEVQRYGPLLAEWTLERQQG